MTVTKELVGHPTDEELAACIEDRLDDNTEEKIRNHINRCDSCRDRFLDLIQSEGKE